jgi:hypothetical protein
MEEVEGFMELLKLTAAEQKGIRVGQTSAPQNNASDPQVVGKVMAENW